LGLSNRCITASKNSDFIEGSLPVALCK
jgi:hypothetical protein